MATMMINSGQPLAVVSKYMGHSSIRVTADIYTHRDSVAELKVANAMGEILKKRKKEKEDE
jgi:integrase